MSDNLAVFTKYNDKYVLMHIVHDRAEYIFVFDDLDCVTVGTVINCRVEKNIDNIDASFVSFAPKTSGFINKTIKPGTLLPLQYKKEAYNTKKAQFSDKITIDGEYTVVTEGSRFVKVSSKIDQDKKQQIIDRFMPLSDKYGFGIIIRTKTGTDPDGYERAEDELEKIHELLCGIKERSEHTMQHTILYRPLPGYIKDINSLIDLGIEEIVTDDTDISDAVKAKYESISGPVNVTDRVSLRFYDDKMLGLCNLYSFNAKISEALSRKVYLKSGAYITIDTTEALTAIDVNSAGSKGKHEKEDTFLDVNIEAAKEITRQLRIRNISGMIIIDFISMDEDDNYDELIKCLKAELAKDLITARFIDLTGLKLAEVIRNRTGKTLWHNIGADNGR